MHWDHGGGGRVLGCCHLRAGSIESPPLVVKNRGLALPLNPSPGHGSHDDGAPSLENKNRVVSICSSEEPRENCVNVTSISTIVQCTHVMSSFIEQVLCSFDVSSSPAEHRSREECEGRPT